MMLAGVFIIMQNIISFYLSRLVRGKKFILIILVVSDFSHTYVLVCRVRKAAFGSGEIYSAVH